MHMAFHLPPDAEMSRSIRDIEPELHEGCCHSREHVVHHINDWSSVQIEVLVGAKNALPTSPNHKPARRRVITFGQRIYGIAS